MVCFWSWPVLLLFPLCTLLFPSFWYQLIFVPRMLFQVPSCFWGSPLFPSCGEPSVLSLVKGSLDCWLWHSYTYLMESVLDLSNCCEEIFLHQGNYSSVIHFSCFLRYSGMFGDTELTSAFLLLVNVPYAWFGPLSVLAISLTGLFWFFIPMMDLILKTDSSRFQMQIPWLGERSWLGTRHNPQNSCGRWKHATKEQGAA